MDIATLIPHLPERHRAGFPAIVDRLETAVATGAVPNKLFIDSKSTINWCVEKGSKAFLDTGPHDKGHHMSDWWLVVYNNNAFIHGAHNIPTALKRAQKANMTEYAAFLTALVPLNDLLQAAKPLIVKRVPGQKCPATPAQMAREAATMTCQCCGKRYLANLGTMAHHGYQRPGGGWQTASCYGAKALPFEVDRKILGSMIIALKNFRDRLISTRQEMVDEKHSLSIQYTDYSKPRVWNSRAQQNKHPTVTVSFIRETFDAEMETHKAGLTRYGNNIRTFDEIKANDLAQRDGHIAGVEMDIHESQKRFDGWKQTHKWDKASKVWALLSKEG